MKTKEEIEFDLFCDRLFKCGTCIMASIIGVCMVSSAVVNILRVVGA